MIIGVASADYLRADRSSDGVEKWGGAGWARLGQYIPYFREAGHEVYVGTLWQREGKLAVEQADGSVEFPDVILLQRIMHDKVDQSIKFGQEHGQIVSTTSMTGTGGWTRATRRSRHRTPSTTPSRTRSSMPRICRHRTC